MLTGKVNGHRALQYRRMCELLSNRRMQMARVHEATFMMRSTSEPHTSSTVDLRNDNLSCNVAFVSEVRLREARALPTPRGQIISWKQESLSPTGRYPSSM
jgi:hypothetical protein